MKPKILFFTGNRAEFGYLLPFLIELNTAFELHLFVTGSHLLAPWNTIEDIYRDIKRYNLDIVVHSLKIPQSENSAIDSSHTIEYESSQLLKKEHFEYAFVLGDRPESLAFATAAFLRQTPLIHYAGGDVTNNNYLDSTIRHAITKLAHLHLTLTNASSEVVKQLGEEAWRVHHVGVSTFDFERLSLLPSKEELQELLAPLSLEKELVIFTYHAAHYKSAEENLKDFVALVGVLEALEVESIITYPNNDNGSADIIKYLEQTKFAPNILVKKNLGTLALLGLYKECKSIVVGNSSGGLIETSYFCTPTLNIGDRQGDRDRVENVTNVALDAVLLRQEIVNIIQNYESIQKWSAQSRYYFGKAESSLSLKKVLLDEALTREKLLYKRFIRRG